MTTQTGPNTSQRVFNMTEFLLPPGQKRVVSVYRDQDMGALMEWCEPGTVAEEIHKHPESSHIFVFIQGEGEVLVGNGKWEKVKAGQFYVCPRDRAHAVRNNNTERLVWFCASVSHGKYVVQNTNEHDA